MNLHCEAGQQQHTGKQAKKYRQEKVCSTWELVAKKFIVLKSRCLEFLFRALQALDSLANENFSAAATEGK